MLSRPTLRTNCLIRLPEENDAPIPYTSSPWSLVYADIVLFFSKIFHLLGIVWPIKAHHELDELYPSWANLHDIAVHFVLFVLQAAFIVAIILSLVFCFLVNLGVLILCVGVFVLVNYLLCMRLNGCEPFFESNVKLPDTEDHSEERWIFLNGVAVGHHWLESNINQLSQTFGRSILGIHNPTAGIIFDVLQCLIQRDFNYVTQDIRDAYVKVKEALYDPQYKKVVFILHSQGGIEGGMIIDWLLDEVPQALLQQLEVYTFGNAANHFNNPLCIPPQSGMPLTSGLTAYAASTRKVLGHVEHYANSGDFVSLWGILHFIISSPPSQPGHTDDPRSQRNRFVGHVFKRPGSGHQLNQHYLDNMFTLGADGRVVENNPFMDMRVELDGEATMNGDDHGVHYYDIGSPVDGVNGQGKPNGNGTAPGAVGKKVRDFSRLWLYRNGRVPPSKENQLPGQFTKLKKLM